MTSDGNEKSLSGISIPKWIRSGRTLDLDQNTFSPPERDDTFMHIRYPRTNSEQQNPNTTLSSLTARLSADGARSRRGSKSLPASPLVSPKSSPKARRRMDRFYAPEGQQSGWILAGLLDSLSQSVTTIAEGTPSGSRADLDTILQVPAEVPIQPIQQLFRPKPSELREMNFWSPTSM